MQLTTGFSIIQSLEQRVYRGDKQRVVGWIWPKYQWYFRHTDDQIGHQDTQLQVFGARTRDVYENLSNDSLFVCLSPNMACPCSSPSLPSPHLSLSVYPS